MSDVVLDGRADAAAEWSALALATRRVATRPGNLLIELGLPLVITAGATAALGLGGHLRALWETPAAMVGLTLLFAMLAFVIGSWLRWRRARQEHLGFVAADPIRRIGLDPTGVVRDAASWHLGVHRFLVNELCDAPQGLVARAGLINIAIPDALLPDTMTRRAPRRRVEDRRAGEGERS